MIYIEKEELPDSVKEKIIGLSKSEEWGNIDEKETDKIRSFFDNYFPKTEVKEVLVREQKDYVHIVCVEYIGILTVRLSI